MEIKGQNCIEARSSPHAFHSPLMEPILGMFKMMADMISFKTPTLPVISKVIGRRVLEEPHPFLVRLTKLGRYSPHFQANVDYDAIVLKVVNISGQHQFVKETAPKMNTQINPSTK